MRSNCRARGAHRKERMQQKQRVGDSESTAAASATALVDGRPTTATASLTWRRCQVAAPPPTYPRARARPNRADVRPAALAATPRARMARSRRAPTLFRVFCEKVRSSGGMQDTNTNMKPAGRLWRCARARSGLGWVRVVRVGAYGKQGGSLAPPYFAGSTTPPPWRREMTTHALTPIRMATRARPMPSPKPSCCCSVSASGAAATQAG